MNICAFRLIFVQHDPVDLIFTWLIYLVVEILDLKMVN